MKKFISAFLTLLILLISNLLLSRYFKLQFLELSFMTGLMFTIIIGFFSSEGGILTEISNCPIKYLLNKNSQTNTDFIRFYINIPFIVALTYTILSAIFSLIAYWKYF